MKIRGFTLIEVAVTITVIAIMVTYAVPLFQRSLEQQRVDLAAATLYSLWTAERLYYTNNQYWASSVTGLSDSNLLDPMFVNNNTASSRYLYSIALTAEGFDISASRQNSETWSGSLVIDETGAITGSITGSGAALTPASNQ
jgi:prepilin-type N-terminal cleavage/methylation domain-containing protein